MEPAPGLYVHVPFCSVKCFYCDFAAFSGQGRSAGRYLRALRREAAAYAPLGFSPRTLYVGGGTPSELNSEQLAELLDLVEASFGRVRDLVESTVEANPESLDAEKLRVLAERGVSRLSLGLQTADDGLLRAVGRRHGYDDFLRVYRAARSCGFQINVDLMVGLPGQDLPSAENSVRHVLGLSPDHVSLYGLQVEDFTLFARRGVEPEEGLVRDMLDSARAALTEAGLRHYEISNYARPGRESVHNVNYWLDGEYLGLGCGAAGHLGGERYQNEERLAPYLGRVEAGERPVASSERLSGREKLGERLMLGLRLLEGAPLDSGLQAEFRPEIARLRGRGLVELKGAGSSRSLPRLGLTREGVFLANEAFREFVT